MAVPAVPLAGPVAEMVGLAAATTVLDIPDPQVLAAELLLRVAAVRGVPPVVAGSRRCVCRRRVVGAVAADGRGSDRCAACRAARRRRGLRAEDRDRDRARRVRAGRAGEHRADRARSDGRALQYRVVGPVAVTVGLALPTIGL